jgi:hypothetical protein
MMTLEMTLGVVVGVGRGCLFGSGGRSFCCCFGFCGGIYGCIPFTDSGSEMPWINACLY